MIPQGNQLLQLRLLFQLCSTSLKKFFHLSPIHKLYSVYLSNVRQWQPTAKATFRILLVLERKNPNNLSSWIKKRKTFTYFWYSCGEALPTEFSIKKKHIVAELSRFEPPNKQFFPFAVYVKQHNSCYMYVWMSWVNQPMVTDCSCVHVFKWLPTEKKNIAKLLSYTYRFFIFANESWCVTFYRIIFHMRIRNCFHEL